MRLSSNFAATHQIKQASTPSFSRGGKCHMTQPTNQNVVYDRRLYQNRMSLFCLELEAHESLSFVWASLSVFGEKSLR